MADFNVRLLGGFEVSRRTGAFITLPTRKARALLALLARHPGRRQAREALAAMFWPDSVEPAARSNLRQVLKLLRRTLDDRGNVVISADGDTLALLPGAAEVDVELFERLHETGRPDALERAAALYRGDFLEGVSLADGAFADWSMVERVQLRERALDVFSRLFDDRLTSGRTEAAVEAALRLLALDPLQEHVHRQLIRLYLAQGRRGLALAQYRACRAILEGELGIRPDPETDELYQDIRRRRAGVTASALVPPGKEDVTTPSWPVDALLARPAVAVLPFTSLGDDPVQAYFSDGLSEDIITALAGWRTFPLIASASTFTYREGGTDLSGMAAALGARYLVDGSVRCSGAKVRITAHLIEAGSARCLWSERFDLDLQDVLAVQTEASERIAAAVEPELEQAELRRIVTKRTDNWSAWDYYLRGWSLLKRYTTEDDARARSNFEQALRLDADYSDALMGLAQSHLQDIGLAPDASREKSLAQGLEAAHEAVRLDPNSSAAHAALGHAHVWAEEFQSAIVETERAVELNPSNALARASLGNRLDLVGRTAEGVAQLEHALRLNPRDPRRFRFMGFLARAHITLGDYEVALQRAREAVHLRPDLAEFHFRLAVCLSHLDRIEAARAALSECERRQPGFVESRKGWQPYADAARNEHFFAGLRRHGLFS